MKAIYWPKYSTCGETVLAGKMASSTHFKSGLATLAAVLYIFGIIFPFGSTCTGEYNAIVAENIKFIAVFAFEGTVETRVLGFHGTDNTQSCWF